MKGIKKMRMEEPNKRYYFVGGLHPPPTKSIAVLGANTPIKSI